MVVSSQLLSTTMKKVLLVMAVMAMVQPALLAAPKKQATVNCDKVNSGCNIFSDPENAGDVAPGFRTATDARGRIREMIDAEASKFPNYQQLKQIPGLNAQQKKDIEKIYNATKETIQPWLNELKEMRPKPGDKISGEQYFRDQIENGPGKELVQKIQATRETGWNQVKALLTEQQLVQLDQMRHGEMLTGLNAPNMPPGMSKQGSFRPSGVVGPPPNMSIAPVEAN
ncbi:MAG: hypothetical protein U0105_05075 [Candidatus Obscuribacterales bacterium]